MQFDKGYTQPVLRHRPRGRRDGLRRRVPADHHAEDLRDRRAAAAAGEGRRGRSKPLVIIAEDVDGEALSTLVVNAIRKTFSAVAVKAPFFGDRRKAFLQDLAIVTGGQVIAPEIGLKLDQAGLDVLGRAGRVTVTKDTTTITHGAAAQDEVDARIAQIRREIEDTDSDWDREKLAGAAGQAVRRRRRDQGRCGDRGRTQGAQAPHRGRHRGDPGGHRAGHHRRRRCGSGPGVRGARGQPRPDR